MRRLASDLAVLGKPAGSDHAPGFFGLTSFAHALGAFYVQEGSTLGGQIVLRHLEKARIGIPAEAQRFFAGHGPRTRSSWTFFVTALDAFGLRHPEVRTDVLEGARLTFEAIIAWFEPRTRSTIWRPNSGA